MDFEIIGDVDKQRIFCSGSFTKLLTTFVILSFLSENHALAQHLDEESWFDSLCQNQEAHDFLELTKSIIGSQFSLHDICSFYTGLPYTFDVSTAEIMKVEQGYSLKHHSIIDEATFMNAWQYHISPLYKNKNKFHYSELAIIFLGYFIEKNFSISIESLYQQYVLQPFKLKSSYFSRILVDNVYIQDLSPIYDYPSVAILDHGYFCYSNGFYTTLEDMQRLLSQLMNTSIFKIMTATNNWRAVSPHLLNGLTVEIRLNKDDILFGYEGLSFSGCNIWAFSTKRKRGYLTFTDNEETAYDILYRKLDLNTFDVVPANTQQIYKNFHTHYNSTASKLIPEEYRGEYHRVKINNSNLPLVFEVGPDFVVIRNPEMIRYEVVWYQNEYRIKGKDGIPGIKVGFNFTEINRYFYLDGTLYQKII